MARDPDPKDNSVSTSSKASSPPVNPDVHLRTFRRFRSSIEQSIRAATRTRSNKHSTSSVSADANGLSTTSTTVSKGKEKEDVVITEVPAKVKTKMLPKVTFKLMTRDGASPSSATGKGHAHKRSEQLPAREPGSTSYLTPSLRLASLSSPALHQYSRVVSDDTHTPEMVSSTSNVDVLVSPHRTRSKSSKPQPPSISGPSALTPRRSSKESTRESKNASKPKLTLTQTPTTVRQRDSTDTPRQRDRFEVPDSPSPPSRRFGTTRGSASTSHLPLSPSSPTQARSPTPRHSPTTPATGDKVRRPSFDSSNPCRPSVEGRYSALSTSRPNSPPSQIRHRVVTPNSPSRTTSPTPLARGDYTYNKNLNLSTASLSSSVPANLSNTGNPNLNANPEHRDLLRQATSILCKELLKPPGHNTTGLGVIELEEIELKLRALARLERIWGKSGGANANGVSNTSGGVITGFGVLGPGGVSSTGEDRERRLFSEALRNGYVLCQLMNKVRPGSIARVDKREDGVVRTSNVTKFLASCSSTLGLSSGDLFHRDDLIEGSFESLARVSRTIIALIEISENPPPDRSRLQGRGPYGQSSGLSRAAQSTPNLVRCVSPSLPFHDQGRARAEVPVPVPTPKNGSSPIPIVRRRWSPITGCLPPVHSSTPTIDDDAEVDVDEDGMVRSSRRSRITRDEDDGDTANGYESGSGSRGGGHRRNRFDHRSRDDVPPILTPPPRSPLRPKLSYDRNRQILSSPSVTISPPQVDLSLSSTPPRDMQIHHPRPSANEMRQSVASSTLSDTTTFSSLLDPRRSLVSNQGGVNGGRFGTTRTATTEATSYFVSDVSSFGRTEANSIIPSLNDDCYRGRKRSGGDPRSPGLQDRKLSETAGADLTRVTEEVESGGSGMVSRLKPREKSSSGEDGRNRSRHAIRLGKGKWPDDFFPPGSLSPGRDLSESPKPITPLSTTPPRKLAIVGRSNDSTESLPQFPRRPTHRSRHSLDTAPSLLPKDSVFGRDASPDNRTTPPTPKVIMPRRVSQGRNPSLLGRSSLDNEGQPALDGPVPFPRTVSGSGDQSKQGNATSDPAAVADVNKSQATEKPKLVRGRFQSEIDGSSSRRRPRPTSDDGSGQNPGRSRFESMVNLGVATGTASASDLLNRNALEGNTVRPTLIVREEGKPATQFQLGNCIGRGQFGAVYRALNLNTGQMVAVKRISLTGLKEEEISQLMKEVDLVKSLSHPSIVKYEGMARDEGTLSIILEYAENGSLGQTLKAFGKLNERLVASYVVKILEGLHYLHQSDVVHCDLKAANILTTKTGNVKLSDFGVSLNLRAMEREMKDVAGTPNWMAPEVIELKGASPKSDIWSLGCTVIELLTGRPPYADIPNGMSVMFRIVEDTEPPIPETVSPLLDDFLRQCFHKDPAKRPDAEILCEHEWLKKNWGLPKELRPQDSIPFLRRVSADYNKADIRYLLSSNNDSTEPKTPVRDEASRIEEPPQIHPSPPTPARRTSQDNDNPAVQEHSFVKTTFGKPVICRVCNLPVKRSAVLCDQCSLIAHSKCAHNAPPTCNLRAQLLLYAQYAEKGCSPLELLGPMTLSPSAEGVSTPRTSFDFGQQSTSSSTTSPVHPPTAFKVLTAFKRSRSMLSPEPAAQSTPSVNSIPAPRERRTSLLPPNPLRRKDKEVAKSLSSNSTSPGPSSLRSQGRDNSGSNTRRSAGARSESIVSGDNDMDVARLSRITGYSVISAGSDHEHEEICPTDIPGGLPSSPTTSKKRTSKNNDGCLVQ
ncbi:hypothetical protein BDM02DRAFT_3189769 [Thelephora ganbajun]|uniref:Uncharacterized protein n=1 Tax=Thelephora ganbajun TaxID=370292 RepID=A0ACB6Z759_THEGA|nr:hypothetical protein BDM02DRAFT_3189769 [Thelephora ganbajun]